MVGNRNSFFETDRKSVIYLYGVRELSIFLLAFGLPYAYYARSFNRGMAWCGVIRGGFGGALCAVRARSFLNGLSSESRENRAETDYEEPNYSCNCS